MQKTSRKEMLLHYVGQHNPQELKALILVGTPVSVWQTAKNKLFGFASWSINHQKNKNSY